MNVFRFFLVGSMFFATAAWSNSYKVEELIEERAFEDLSRIAPPESRISIRMAAGMVTEGSFIKEFWIDADTGQFIANVVSQYGETNRVWGMAVTTIDVPVPARRILPEEIVQESDISMVELPVQRLGSFAIYDADDLVGKQVRRMLVAGRPVPRQSVVPPRVISRGEKVKIILKHGGLSLTASGRAMSDAHIGQTVRVVNLSSNRTINSIALSKGVVEVDQ